MQPNIKKISLTMVYGCSSGVLQHELLTTKHRLGRSVFTPKQVFGPRTAKSQPIWIKFCEHLLLYGIHL